MNIDWTDCQTNKILLISKRPMFVQTFVPVYYIATLVQVYDLTILYIPTVAHTMRAACSPIT